MSSKELSLRLIRKNLRIQNPEVVEAAYEDGVTLSYPNFTERQFKISLELLEKSMDQPVPLSYPQVIDHTLIDEINRPGGNKPWRPARRSGCIRFSRSIDLRPY